MAADHDHHRVQAAAAMVRKGGVDSARSWLVAVSCCWINFFSALMYKSSGVVYVGVLQTLEVTREEASWPLTLLAVFIFTTAPVAGVLALYVDIWKISLCGCLLSSFAVCLCFWANSVIYLTACLGVVQGFALGLLTLHNVIINQHFEKHRATASGISYAGPTFASIVYPPLVQVLFEEYGLRGSLLLFGGIMFHAVAGAFLQMEPNPRKTSYKVVPRDPPPEDTECSKLAGESFEKPKDGELTALNPLDCAADVQQTAAATNIETDILCTNRSADVPKHLLGTHVLPDLCLLRHRAVHNDHVPHGGGGLRRGPRRVQDQRRAAHLHLLAGRPGRPPGLRLDLGSGLRQSGQHDGPALLDRRPGALRHARVHDVRGPGHHGRGVRLGHGLHHDPGVGSAHGAHRAGPAAGLLRCHVVRRGSAVPRQAAAHRSLPRRVGQLRGTVPPHRRRVACCRASLVRRHHDAVVPAAAEVTCCLPSSFRDGMA